MRREHTHELSETYKFSTFQILIIGFFILLIGIVLTIGYVIGSFLDTAERGMSEVKNTLSEALIKNPEVAVAALDNNDNDAFLLTILKQMSLQGEAKGHFSKDIKVTYEKADPSCVDQYTYTQTPEETNLEGENKMRQIIEMERLKDQGCSKFRTENNTAFYKCPEHNCAQKAITQEQAGSFIPETITITKIN